MLASDLMVEDFDTISASETLLEAVSRMRRRPLDTGHIDVRCMVVEDADGKPQHLLTEADLIKSILPWFFREKKFSDFLGKWLEQDVPEAALEEVFHDLARQARHRKISELIGEQRLVTVDAGASLIKLAYTLHAERIKSIPVTREGRVVGMVYRAAVFEAIADAMLAKRGSGSDPSVRAPAASE